MLKPVRSHLAVDAGRAEEGGAAVLGAVAVGDAEAAPGPAPQQAHRQAGEEARQEEVEAPGRANPGELIIFDSPALNQI